MSAGLGGKVACSFLALAVGPATIPPNGEQKVSNMRWIWTLVMAIVVLAVAAIGLVLILPGEKIAKIAADQVRSQTGRELTFTGDVGISWYPVLGVTTGPVSLSNADWSTAGPMFSAESAAIGVNVMSLIGGDIKITKIEATKPDVLLERAKDGRVNWELFPSDGADAPDGQGAVTSGITLDNLAIQGARLRYVDHGGGDSFEIKEVDAGLRWPGQGRPADITMTLLPAKDKVQIRAQVGDLDAFSAGDISSVTAVLTAAGATVSFDGRGSTTPQAAGRIEADLPKPNAFLAALGVVGAAVPGATKLSGDITLTKAGLFSLRGGKVSVGVNSLSAEADVQLGARPHVTARLGAGDLDLSAFMASGGSSAAQAGWSKAQIDASALGLFDGDIALSARSVNLGDLKFGASRVTVKVDRSRAVFELHDLQGYEGKITGQFVANNRNGLSVGGSMLAKGVSMQHLLGDLMDVKRLSGRANVDVRFLGVGNSVHGIMNSLKGDGALKIGQGTIDGIDLDKLFRGSPVGGTTVFDALSASVQISKGVMRNDDLVLDLPRIEAKGQGTIGLGARNLDYTFTPQLRKETGDGLSVPVRMKGSWDNPRIWPDLEAVVNQNFKEEKEEVRSKIKERVNEELGVVVEEGQSTEDAVKKKIEDEVKNKLFDLLK